MTAVIIALLVAYTIGVLVSLYGHTDSAAGRFDERTIERLKAQAGERRKSDRGWRRARP